MVAMLPLTMVRLLASDLKGRGRAGLVSVSTAIGLGATVVLDLALVPPLGIVGAAVASLVAYTVTAVALSLGFQRVTGQSALALIPRPSDAAVLARQATCGLGARLVGRGRAR
jgi:Na+-driven multidrug efflux pump